MTKPTPDPLPLDHPAWQRLFDCFIAACEQRQPNLLEIFDSLDYFQFALYRGQVVVAPLMKADGLYYRVAVRADDTGKVTDVLHVHSANVGMTDDELAADEWLANALTLAKGAPDSPEGIDAD